MEKEYFSINGAGTIGCPYAKNRDLTIYVITNSKWTFKCKMQNYNTIEENIGYMTLGLAVTFKIHY